MTSAWKKRVSLDLEKRPMNAGNEQIVPVRVDYDKIWNRSYVYMTANIHKSDMTIAKICAASFTTRKVLYKAWHEKYGHGPWHWVHVTRMNMARKLFQETTLRTLDVALDCGYKNRTSFERAFKQFFEMTPTQCRRMA